MLKDFLKNFKEDRVETFTFVLLTIFTYGLYAIYWLGKLNKSFKGVTKRHLVAENLIIVFVKFSFVIPLVQNIINSLLFSYFVRI